MRTHEKSAWLLVLDVLAWLVPSTRGARIARRRDVGWDRCRAGERMPRSGRRTGNTRTWARTRLWGSSLAPAAGLRPGPGVGARHRARDADRLPYKLGSSRRVPRTPRPFRPQSSGPEDREDDDARLCPAMARYVNMEAPSLPAGEGGLGPRGPSRVGTGGIRPQGCHGGP